MQSVYWDCKKETMKKIIAILLVLAICGSFIGCSEREKISKTDIVGEWMSPAVNAAATFREDGAGELTLNGTDGVTWEYDVDKDLYLVKADKLEKTYNVTFAVEYEMPILTIDGIDFYRPDDYDKALTLLISRRYEDITEHTVDMKKVEINKVYDLNNGVTITFTDVAVTKSDLGDGLNLKFQIMNNRTDRVTDGLTLGLNFRYYLFDQNDVISKTDHMVLAAYVDAESACEGTFPIPLDFQTEKTVSRYGRVIGAVTFEMYGVNYFIDLSDYFR